MVTVHHRLKTADLFLHYMAKPFRQRTITSVDRAYSCDPLERVESIGGVNSDHTRWKFSQAAAIALIEKGTDEFCFSVGEQTVRVVVLTRDGEKYLQSEREKTHPDDLLNAAVPASGNIPRPVYRPRIRANAATPGHRKPIMLGRASPARIQ